MTLLLRNALSTAILPGSVLLWIPWLLIVGRANLGAHWPPHLIDAPGFALMATGWAIYFMCAWRFATEGNGTAAPWDAPNRIVMGGLYRWTRNPMYVGVIIALIGEALWIRTPAMIAYAAAASLMFHIRVLTYEEPAMRRLSKSDFLAYTSRVKRWGFF